MNNNKPDAAPQIYKNGRLKSRKEMAEDGTSPRVMQERGVLKIILEILRHPIKAFNSFFPKPPPNTGSNPDKLRSE